MNSCYIVTLLIKIMNWKFTQFQPHEFLNPRYAYDLALSLFKFTSTFKFIHTEYTPYIVAVNLVLILECTSPQSWLSL